MSDYRPLPVIEAGIPESLKKSGPRWCVWKLEIRDGKPNKVPYQTETRKGQSNNPKTWLTYEQAITLYKSGKVSGIGLYMGGNLKDGFDDLTGLDWDHLTEAGIPEDEITGILSYAETSPSGTGARCFCLLDKIPGNEKKKNNREIYKSGRFLTVTGHHIEGSPGDIRQADPEGLKVFYSRLVGRKEETPVSSPQISTQEREPVPDRSEDEIIRIAGKNTKFKALWKGPVSSDHSSDDIALCNILAWASGRDPVMIDRVFRRSGLYRDKWDEYRGNLTYGQITIQKAISDCKSVYTPPDNSPVTLKDRDTRATGKKPRTCVKVYSYEPPEDQMKKALMGLEACNTPPELFVRSGEMVRIIIDEHGYPSIEPVSEVALRTRIYDCVEYLNKKDTKIRPPLDAIRDIIHGRQWVSTFPHITGITETPVIHPDGKILSEEGYDEKTGLYYSPSPGLTIPPIPLQPTKEDVQKAVKIIWEPFKQFSFVDKADGTHILAGLITIVCRNLITGNTPILLIDKPQAGTGASLISQIFGLISEGRDPAINSMPASEEEWKKVVLSLLINGRPSVILDNIEGKLKSPALAALLTTQEYSDRRLGTNDNITLSHRIVWIGNGNNIQLGGDLPRRAYWSRMDAESVRPWMDDKQYEHPDLRKWVIENRGEILAGILTLTRAWIQAGRPKPNPNIPKVGGFEQWRDVIGGILEYAGIPGFLGNLQKMYDTTDTETPQWDLFVEAWYEQFKEEPQTTREIFRCITPKRDNGAIYCTCPDLREALPDQFLDHIEREGSFTRVMGKAMSMRKDRRYPSGFKIEHAGEVKRAVRWRVVEIEKQSTLSDQDTT